MIQLCNILTNGPITDQDDLEFCVSTKQETTRDSLIDAAIRVFAARPAASLTDVAEAAGVRRVTLHRLIGSRDDLLKEIAIQSIAEMDEVCHQAVENADSAIDALRACVEALVPVGDRCHFLWTQTEVWKEATVAKEVARQNHELADLIDQAKSEGSIAADIPNAWITAAIEAVVFAALQTARAGDIAVNDAGKLAARTLLAGIGTSPTNRRRKK